MVIRNSIAVLAALGLAACAPVVASESSEFLEGPPVQNVETPYSAMVACAADKAKGLAADPFMIAIGGVVDGTGKYNYDDGSGYYVSQRPNDMLYSIVWQTGLGLPVERTDVAILEWEIRNAKERLIGDGETSTVTKPDGSQTTINYRPIPTGIVAGSDYYIAGSITNLDFAINSVGAEASVAGIGGGARTFRALVSLDLRMVDSRTGRIVAAAPIHKEIVGQEVEVGVARFFGQTLVNIGGGSQQNEPISLVLRSMLEYATVKMMAGVYDSAGLEGCMAEVELLEGVSDATS